MTHLHGRASALLVLLLALSGLAFSGCGGEAPSVAKESAREGQGEDRDWAAAQTANTLEALEAFVAKYPESAQHAEAERLLAPLREASAWSAASETDNAEAYRTFLSAHPDSAHAEAAQQALTEWEDWQRAQAANTIDAVDGFIAAHPESSQRADADRLRVLLEEERDWAAARDADDLEAYTAFLSRHPQSHRVDAAEAAVETLRDGRWQEVRATDTVDAYRAFMATDADHERALSAQKRIDELIDEQGDAALPPVERFTIDLKSSEAVGMTFDRFIVSASRGGGLSVGSRYPFYKRPINMMGETTMGMVTEQGNEWLIGWGQPDEEVSIADITLRSDPMHPLLFKMTEHGLTYIGGRGTARAGDEEVALGEYYTLDRFLAQIRSKHDRQRHTAVWALGQLGETPAEQDAAAEAIASVLGQGPAQLDIAAAEALYLLARPVAVQPLQEYSAALRGREDLSDTKNARLSEAIHTGAGVLSPEDNYGRGKGPWYMHIVEEALVRCAQASPEYGWPPADAGRQDPSDPQFRRIYVPLTFSIATNSVGSLSMVAEEAGVVLKTEREGDGLPMQIGQMMGGGGASIPTRPGSEVRFGGEIPLDQVTLVVPEGRLAFRKTDLGWAYVCGAGTVRYSDGMEYTLGHGRTASDCVANLTNDDPLVREGAARDLARLSVPEGERAAVLEALRRLAEDTSGEVRAAAAEAVAAINGDGEPSERGG